MNSLAYTLISKTYYYIVLKKRRRYLKNLVNKGLKLGKNIDIIDTFFFDPSHCFLISIGDNCTICPNVRLIAHDASTKKILGYTKIGKIDIGANCFIGDSVIVLPNVSIGSNTIIGAGSIVTKSIDSNSVAAGIPAKVICSIDDYCEKIESIRQDKEIFDESYSIENINEEKKKELLKMLNHSLGFIV